MSAFPDFLDVGTYTATVTLRSDDPSVAPVVVPVTMTLVGEDRIFIVSGDGQEVRWGTARTRFAQGAGAPRLRTPLSDSFVNFVVSLGGGSVDPTSDVTDGDGYVATRWRMSDVLGTHGVTVRRTGFRSAFFIGTSVAGTFVTRVAITASRTTFSSLGDSERYSASAFNLADSLITSKTLLWESTDLAVATVDDSGTVSIVGAGTTYIRASVDDGIELGRRRRSRSRSRSGSASCRATRSPPPSAPRSRPRS